MATADVYGLFWDSVSGDRTYNADSFETWLKKFFTSGVFVNELEVTAGTGMSINVSGGYANVDGKVKMFSDTSFTLSPASGVYPRIDSVIIRRDNVDRTVSMIVLQGEYSGQSPQAPAITRNDSYYDLKLADIMISSGATAITQENITDKRADTTVCGYVTGTVEEIDFEQITAQWNSYFAQWFENIKDQLDSDAAGHLQNEIDDIDTRIDGVDTRVDNLISSCYVFATPSANHSMTANSDYTPAMRIISENGGWTANPDGLQGLVCPRAGKYLIISEMTFSPSANTTAVLESMVQTDLSSTQYKSRNVSTGGGTVTVQLSVVKTLSAGERVIQYFHTPVAGSLVSTATNSRIIIRGISE